MFRSQDPWIHISFIINMVINFYKEVQIEKQKHEQVKGFSKNHQ